MLFAFADRDDANGERSAVPQSQPETRFGVALEPCAGAARFGFVERAFHGEPGASIGGANVVVRVGYVYEFEVALDPFIYAGEEEFVVAVNGAGIFAEDRDDFGAIELRLEFCPLGTIEFGGTRLMPLFIVGVPFHLPAVRVAKALTEIFLDDCADLVFDAFDARFPSVGKRGGDESFGADDPFFFSQAIFDDHARDYVRGLWICQNGTCGFTRTAVSPACLCRYAKSIARCNSARCNVDTFAHRLREYNDRFRRKCHLGK